MQEVGKDPFSLPWEGILCPLVTWESYGQTVLSKVFGPRDGDLFFNDSFIHLIVGCAGSSLLHLGFL